MKTVLGLLAGLIVVPNFTVADDVSDIKAKLDDRTSSFIRIEVGDENYGEKNTLKGKYNDREVYSRLRTLERAVRELQGRVWEAEMENRRLREIVRDYGRAPVVVAESKQVTCYISQFGKTYSATEPTETAARAKALERCGRKEGHCFESGVKCGS